MDIERFDLVSDGCGGQEMKARATGAWVRFDDHYYELRPAVNELELMSSVINNALADCNEAGYPQLSISETIQALAKERDELRAKLAAMESHASPADKPVVAVPEEWRRIVERVANMMRMSGAVSHKDSLNPLHSWLHDAEALLASPSNRHQSVVCGYLISDGFTEQFVKTLSDEDRKAAQRFNWDVITVCRCPNHESTNQDTPKA